MQRDKPGDSFAKLILGTLTFFRGVTTRALHNKQKVMELVTSSTWALGIVADPDFDQDAGRYACIFEITRVLDGLIFNGWGMIDENGLMVLDKAGNLDEILM